MIGFKRFGSIMVHRFLHLQRDAVLRTEKSDGTVVDIDMTELAQFDAVVDSDGNVALGKTALDSRTAGSALDNVAVGDAAGTALTTGDDNVLIGEDAGKALTTASDVTAVGSGALAASTAEGNTAVGAAALAANITGLRNVAIGENAGAAQAGTTDDDNVFVGANAGKVANGSASGGNVAIGSNAMLASTTAIDTVAVGFNALAANVTGNSNVAVGADAMLIAAGATDDDSVAVGTGALRAMNGSASGENTAVGSEAGATVTTGVNNTLVGRFAGGTTLTTGTGNTVVGADSTTSAAGATDQIVLGRGVTGVADAAITLGNATRAITCNYDADQTWDAPSDLRMKNVLASSNLGLSFIEQLQPIEYTFKPVSEWPEEWGVGEDEPLNTNKVILGLGAQHVKAALDSVGETVFHGWSELDTGQQLIGESAFVYPLINAVKELSAKVDSLEQRVQ